jgi:hypothetical protein
MKVVLQPQNAVLMREDGDKDSRMPRLAPRTEHVPIEDYTLSREFICSVASHALSHHSALE